MTRFSILMEMNKCYVCGTTKDLHIHEVYHGYANRDKSIKYGCCISLCAKHHNMSEQGIHSNHKLDLEVKKKMQKKFIEKYPNLDFLSIFKRNYLD